MPTVSVPPLPAAAGEVILNSDVLPAVKIQSGLGQLVSHANLEGDVLSGSPQLSEARRSTQ